MDIPLGIWGIRRTPRFVSICHSMVFSNGPDGFVVWRSDKQWCDVGDPTGAETGQSRQVRRNGNKWKGSGVRVRKTYGSPRPLYS